MFGVRIIEQDFTIHVGTWLTFPRPSRNRSKRILKKLLRRTAREMREPGAVMIGRDILVAHPAIVRLLRAETAFKERTFA